MRDACRTYRREHLLDADSDDSHRHAEHCVNCQRFHEMERATAALVQAHRATLVAPAALRDRIAATLETERASGAAGHRRPSTLRRALIAASVLIPLMVGLVILLSTRSSGRSRADEVAELIVEDHLKYARREDRLQLASASPAEMQGWFEQELQLAAKIPELRNATLVGGRRCKLGGRPAALAFYERRDAAGRSEPISLFVFEPRGEDWSGMHEVTGLAGKRACRHHDRGVGLLVWEERALIYVVTGALDADELAELVAN